jgi:hypothetical protein
MKNSAIRFNSRRGLENPTGRPYQRTAKQASQAKAPTGRSSPKDRSEMKMQHPPQVGELRSSTPNQEQAGFLLIPLSNMPKPLNTDRPAPTGRYMSAQPKSPLTPKRQRTCRAGLEAMSVQSEERSDPVVTTANYALVNSEINLIGQNADKLTHSTLCLRLHCYLPSKL